MRRRTTLVALLALAVIGLAAAGPVSAKDRNKDRIPDRWEKKHNLSLKKKQGRRDQDRDGLKNRAEFRAKTHPRRADSDRDGIDDGDEGAGRISSYNAGTGELVINLFGGKTVSGAVTAGTEIRCGCKGTDDEYGDEDEDGERSLQQGDDDGEEHGDDEDGDDGEHGEEHGDDEDEDDGEHGDGDGKEHGDDEDEDDGEHGEEHGDDEDDHSGHGKGGGKSHGHGDDRRCSTEELVEGAVVSEAELRATADGLVFEEVELVGRNPDGS